MNDQSSGVLLDNLMALKIVMDYDKRKMEKNLSDIKEEQSDQTNQINSIYSELQKIKLNFD